MWPPVVIQHPVFVAASDEIHAFDPATGAPRWRVSYDARMIAQLTAAPMMIRKDPGAKPVPIPVLIALFDKGMAAAFVARNGRVYWSQPLGAPTHFAPASDGVRAFFALDDSRVVALSLADGRVEWEQKLEGMLNQPS